ANQGIEFATSTNVSGVRKTNGRLTVQYEVDGANREFNCDKVLLGVGVQPNTDEIGLENLGIKTVGPGFIEVDGNMRTNVVGIYAVGDVNGKLPLAHVAFDQGVVAAETIAGHDTTPIDNYINMPRCTYCQPQIASTGLTEAQAREQGIDVKIGKVPFQVAGKSVAVGEPEGFAKILIDDESGEVIGAHIIGPEATELIAEIGMLQLLEGTNLELHGMTHAHPTLSEVVREAGAAITNEAIHF
ncbi:MAG: dihydrolipoyl dehydrogenase, partial [Acidimicrobiaceae bacterium]|nr:dihydrolipoyl dehydrogenase [Acidimicrobiaceae bacterium]